MWTTMQQQIIERTSGNTVVVASPGSGKTTVLTEHIVHQLQTRSVDAGNVMLITYTRQAAHEMKVRLSRNHLSEGVTLAALRIGTFHAEAFRMLLQQHVKVPPILGTHDQYALLRRILHDEGFNDTAHITILTHILTKSKSTWPQGAIPARFRRVVHRYELAKKQLSRWDYDDILLEFCNALEHGRLEVPRVEYLLVDEFQDTNQIQWSITRGFRSLWNTRLFVVGDDDQSIYAFRGGSPHWLKRASESGDETDTFMLTRNFRSDKAIVQHAASLIRNNHHRIVKPFEANATAPGWCAGSGFRDDVAEGEATALLLARLATSEPTWRVAVLARTRQQLLKSWTCVKGNHPAVEWHTFHSSKGREWDAVVIVGALEDNPYLREPVTDMEEERRLFYVALTRARHAVWISWSRKTGHKKVKPSRFIKEAEVDPLTNENWEQGIH